MEITNQNTEDTTREVVVSCNSKVKVDEITDRRAGVATRITEYGKRYEIFDLWEKGDKKLDLVEVDEIFDQGAVIVTIENKKLDLGLLVGS